METFRSSGPLKIYWCSHCADIYLNERSCPLCNNQNKETGWIDYEDK